MSAYRAIFLRRTEPSGEMEACRVQPLAAKTIQTAIDEALATMPAAMGITSIDIFCGDDKVETVGTGIDPART